MKGLIFIAGVYGVGKSTLCEAISKTLEVPYYSASDLISNINGESYGVNKIVKDKDNNQNILVDAVNQIYSDNCSILLAGHFCIFDKNYEVDILPEGVFSQLKIRKIILLEADEEVIINNLSKRDEKTYSMEQIVAIKNIEHDQAVKIALKLNLPLIIHRMKFDDSDINNVILKIKEC